MCEPTSIIMGISAAAGLYQTKKNAKAQERATQAASVQRAKEINISNSIKADDRAKKARAARARLKAAAASSGVEGLSIESILNNESFAAGTDVSNIALNTSLAVDANTTATQSRLNSIQQPDYLGTGLQIAGIAANGIQNKKNKPGG